MKDKVSITVVINSEQKVLVLKRTNETKAYPGKWNFPGGGVEEEESIGEAAVRELQEESGLKAETNNLLYFKAYQYPEIALYFFIVNKYSGDVIINKESTEYKWVYPEEILNMDFVTPDLKLIEEIKYYAKLLNEIN